jgi:ATP-dependent protease ClpP protease subunit
MATINILGDIGASVQAEDIITQIQAVKDDKIKVLIASNGGSAFQGLMIHDALKASGKEVTTIALGLGASAAFIIFLAGDKREMGDTSLLMGHNSRTELAGTAAQIRDDLAAMDAIDDRMKAAVMAASGMSEEDAIKLLSKDTFMNAETAMSLGLATDSIQDDIAATLNINKTKKEPVKMATEDEKKVTGFMTYMKAFFTGSDPKALEEGEEDEDKKEKKEDEDAKAEGDEEKPKEDEDAKAEHEDEEKKEEKAEGEDEKEDEEKEDMKAKIAGLEAQLAEANAKAQSEEEAKAEAEKVGSIFSAIELKKINMHQGKTLLMKSAVEVSAALKDVSANATGTAKTDEPKEEIGSKLDQWKAMKAEGNHGQAQKYYTKNVKEIRSEMSKDK